LPKDSAGDVFAGLDAHLRVLLENPGLSARGQVDALGLAGGVELVIVGRISRSLAERAPGLDQAAVIRSARELAVPEHLRVQPVPDAPLHVLDEMAIDVAVDMAGDSGSVDADCGCFGRRCAARLIDCQILCGKLDPRAAIKGFADNPNKLRFEHAEKVAGLCPFVQVYRAIAALVAIAAFENAKVDRGAIDIGGTCGCQAGSLYAKLRRSHPGVWPGILQGAERADELLGESYYQSDVETAVFGVVFQIDARRKDPISRWSG